jgi:ribosomal protein RSM22 (predicted rRNA methylase)
MRTLKGKPPAATSTLVLGAIRQVRPSLESGRLAQAVEELSRLFTKERRSLPSRYLDDPDHAAAYLNYFMPVNLSKVQVLLDELPLEDRGAEQRLRILDVGSGPGTGALAVLDWLHRRGPDKARRLSAVAVDSSRETLRLAGDMWKRYSHEAGIAGQELTLCHGNLERSTNESWRNQTKEQGPYDLIILAVLFPSFCQ